MRYKRGDITYIKINNKFTQVRIIKEVKPYHGKVYYVPGETRYMVDETEVRVTTNSFGNVNYYKITDLRNKSFLEGDIIAWEREYKLKDLGI
jgi:hypothetical protein